MVKCDHFIRRGRNWLCLIGFILIFIFLRLSLTRCRYSCNLRYNSGLFLNRLVKNEKNQKFLDRSIRLITICNWLDWIVNKLQKRLIVKQSFNRISCMQYKIQYLQKRYLNLRRHVLAVIYLLLDPKTHITKDFLIELSHVCGLFNKVLHFFNISEYTRSIKTDVGLQIRV
jgi:hypothetical protein